MDEVGTFLVEWFISTSKYKIRIMNMICRSCWPKQNGKIGGSKTIRIAYMLLRQLSDASIIDAIQPYIYMDEVGTFLVEWFISTSKYKFRIMNMICWWIDT